MPHRRETLIVHAALVIVLLAVAGWYAWVAIATPNGSGEVLALGLKLISGPFAGLALGGAVLVALGARGWASSGRRAPILVGDVGGLMALTIAAIALPDLLVVAAVVTGSLATGFVAANPSRPTA